MLVVDMGNEVGDEVGDYQPRGVIRVVGRNWVVHMVCYDDD